MKKFLFIFIILFLNFGKAEEAEEIELKIFISTSMPLTSIKQYFFDSGKSDAVLVLKGLPGGSFKLLQKILLELGNEYQIQGNMVLDEESFEKFNITEVPTIVLSKGKKFDKISGNITILAALQEIASKGDLSSEAKNLLKKLK